MLGRSLVHIGQVDQWQVMPYLQGDPGSRAYIDYSKNDDWAVGMLLHAMLAGPERGSDPFCSGDDPRRFVDADYQCLDLRAGGYSDTLGEVARGLLRVDPAQRLDVDSALARIEDPVEQLAHERAERTRVEAELAALRRQLAQAETNCRQALEQCTAKDAEIGRLAQTTDQLAQAEASSCTRTSRWQQLAANCARADFD